MMNTLKLGVVAVFFVAGITATACPICYREPTTAQQVAFAHRALIVLPAMAGSEMRVVAIVKGGGTIDDLVQATAPGLEQAAMAESGPLLVTQPDASSPWSIVGAVGPEYAEWLRRMAAAMLMTDATDRQWRERVAGVVPYLGHKEPVIAAIAYGQLAAAPYAALRSIRERLDPARYAGRLDGPMHQPLYTLLYGIAGGSHEADEIELRLTLAWKRNDPTNLAALIAAYLESRGPSRVDWVETMYLADPQRTQAEIRAALLALSMHGTTNAAVPRERVIRAYRFFMQERKAMAGLVAQDLADWRYWDAGPEYLALLKANALQDPASRLAAVSYLKQNPRADVKAAARRLAATAMR
jgi:hypothetical protein